MCGNILSSKLKAFSQYFGNPGNGKMLKFALFAPISGRNKCR